jgi:uncharacterized membrane protein
MRRPIAWRRLTSPSCVAGASALSLALLLARQAVATDRDLWWMAWNLFLAWTPLALGWIALALARAPVSRAAVLVAGLAWLLFLPNAPYLVTDVVHLHRHAHGPALALEVALFGTVALAGLLLGVAAVQPIHRMVAQRYGSLAARAFPPVIAVAVAFGVYLGRVQRWNSWAFIQTPGKLLDATWSVLGHPIAHPRAFGGIALFSLAFLVAYRVLTAERGVLGALHRQSSAP